MSMFDVICSKLHFFKKNCGNTSLKMYCFVCKVNRDLKSENETTYKVVLTPQMQWQPQNFETSLRQKSHFSR